MMRIPDKLPLFAAAIPIAEKMSRYGLRALAVGGAVRDVLLGRRPADIDMVTSATPEELQQIFPGAKFVGASFGVSLIKSCGVEIEVASARSERFYLDGRHPEKISFTRDFALDAARRDFTVNALMLDLISGEILDFTGGLADLAKGIIRTVGDPGARFKEDYLRMFRAVRFAAKLDFTLEPETAKAIGELSHFGAKLSGERIYSELSSMLCCGHAERAFRLLETSGLLAAVLPEVAVLRQIQQPPEFHPEGDVLEHTFIMLRHLSCPVPLLGWMVLFHDVGKAPAVFRDETGRLRFFNHETLGADIAQQLCRRLHFSRSDSEAVVHAVRNHMRFAHVRDMRSAKLRKLMAEPGFFDELELHRLDCISSHNLLEGYCFLLDALNERGDGAATLPEPMVRGRDLVKAGFAPSPRFKPVLETIFERQLAGEFTDCTEALAAAEAMLTDA